MYKEHVVPAPAHTIITTDSCTQARQTRPNSGGVAEGHPRFDKGGGGNNFLLFTR